MTVHEIHTLKKGFSEINLRNPSLPPKRYTKKIEYFLDLHDGETVVDFGCGEGAVLFGLAKEYPNVNFIGIDYSEDLIAFAKKNYKAPGVAPVKPDHLAS